MSGSPSLKSVLGVSVNVPNAERLYSASRMLGNSFSCPLNSDQTLDEFGRPTDIRFMAAKDASCSRYTGNVTDLLESENENRKIVGIKPPGQRGGGDFMLGGTRSNAPKNIYEVQGQNEILEKFGEGVSPSMSYALQKSIYD